MHYCIKHNLEYNSEECPVCEAERLQLWLEFDRA